MIEGQTSDNVEVESGVRADRNSFRKRVTNLFNEYWKPLKLYFMSFPVPMLLWDNRTLRCDRLGIVVETKPEPAPLEQKIVLFTQAQPCE